MTARDLNPEDIDGFLKEWHQRQEETRFAQLDDEWTPATTLEDVAVLLGVFCICLVCLVGPLGYVLWRILS